MNIWITMHMDLNGVDGPGWYLYAARQDTDDPKPVGLIEHVRLTSTQVVHVAEEMDDALKDAQPKMAPSQIVESGVHIIHRSIMDQLAEAERVAVRAAKLKALQEAESPTDKDVE